VNSKHVKLGERLKGLEFARVFSSPLQRARRTGELAGFGAQIEVLDDLSEWHYGAYEGCDDQTDISQDSHRFLSPFAMASLKARVSLK
jgi:broad specificity phosphatase PhoE